MLAYASTAHASHSAKVQLTQWPGEEPTSKEVHDFVEENEPLLRAQYATDFSGRTPAGSMHLEDRFDMTELARVTGTDARTLQGQKHNAMISQQERTNAARATQLQAALTERSNDIATSISISMRMSAPLRLKRLLTSHAQTTYADWHNGVAMWKELMALKNTQ